MNFKDINEMKRVAIEFKKDQPVKWVTCSGKVTEWAPDDDFLRKWDKCYSINNGILAYVDGAVFVIPVIFNVRELVGARFWITMELTENKFYVPLSNGGFLLNSDLRKRWNSLNAVKECSCV